MIDFQQFLIFAFASFLLNITPGNDMVFVATYATNQGVKAGIWASLGIALGCIVHISAAVFGISAIIAQSAFLFDLIKYLGAAYLIYIGLKTIFSKTDNFDVLIKNSIISNWDILKQGIFTNILNPKVALFFLAFLPQFTTPLGMSPYGQYQPVWLQILILGIWFNISGTLVNCAVAFAFGKASSFLKKYPNFANWQNKFTGFTLVALGLRVAFMKK
jgi:threonine/homoserine/homoserine lactone efflux protein